MGVKNTLDEEFFNSNTLRTQERIETSEHEFHSYHGSEMSPEYLEGEMLRGQYFREQQEKLKYRKLYLEL